MQIIVVEPPLAERIGLGAFDQAGSLVSLSNVALWLAVVNFACFAAFTLDKEAARRGAWRIRERTLLWLALLGGSPAALVAQRVLRHKTRKEPFRTQLLGIVAIQVCVAIVFVVVLAVPALREPVLRAAGR